MLANHELVYAQLVQKVLMAGERRSTRNFNALSIFGQQLNFHANSSLVLLQGRRTFYKGVLGELAALLRGPKTLEDFTKWGCNYWKKWADEDGKLTLDYGNSWLRDGQIEHLKHCLASNRTDRRMLITGWRPENLGHLSLPCCHHTYQFYVRGDKWLDILWMQRSVDMMVGLPADMLLAQVWLIALANEFGLKPGMVRMSLGDCHIYEDHVTQAKKYLDNTRIVASSKEYRAVRHEYKAPQGLDFLLFEPDHIEVTSYKYVDELKFSLHE